MAPKLVGADIPSSPTSTIRPGSAVSQGQNVSQQYLANSVETLGKSNEYQQASLRQRYESIQTAQKAVQETISSSAQTAVEIARLKQTQTANPFLGAAEALKEYMSYDEKKRQKAAEEQAKLAQAAAKEASEKDYATAFTEIQKMKVEWQGGGLNDKGVTAYTTALTDTLKKYKNLSYEQVQKLVDDGYGIAVEHAKGQAGKQQEYFDKLRSAQQDTTTASLMFKLSKPLADLKATPYGDSGAIMSQVDGVIAQFLDDPNIDPLSRTLALNVAMKETLSGMDERNVNYAQLQQRVSAVSAYGTYAMQLTQQVEQGALSPQQMKLQLQQKRVELGVPTSYEDPTLYETEKTLKDSLERQRAIQELKQKEAVDAAEASRMGTEETAYLAWAIIQNPGVINQIKSSKIFSSVPGVQTAIDLANEYLEGDKERQKMTLSIQAKREELANAQSRGVTWFIGQANSGQKTSITDYMNAAGLGIELPKDTTGITPEQAAQADAAFRGYQQEVINTISMMEGQWQQMNQRLSSYGLYGNKQDIDTRMKSYKSKYEAYVATFGKPKAQPAQGVPAQQAPFKPAKSTGSGSASQPEFQTIGYQNKKIIVPFLHGARVSDLDNYGQDRGSHKHAGLDMPTPEGTSIVSYVNGVVERVGYDPQGYGNYIDIKGQDGMLHRFAHGQDKGILVSKGQLVSVGTPVMRSGNTGRSEGPHLHWEIRDPSKPFGFDGTVDPLAYMASHDISPSNTTKPRTITDNKFYLPSAASPYDPPKIPANAIPVAGGKYILDGKLHDIVGPKLMSYKPEGSRKLEPISIASAQPQDISQTYSTSAPLRKGVVPRERNQYPERNNPTENHGYAVLARDRAFASKLADVSDRLGIPSQWLADLMAFETAGTLDPSIDNGVGYTGLIQFGDAAAQEVGTSRAALAQMSASQQLEYVYRYLSKFGTDLQKGPEYLLASVWGGQGLVNDLNKRGAASILDPSWNDFAAGGGATFKSYLEGLGSHAGRQYAYLGSSRRARIQTTIHTKFTQGCKVCAALRSSNSPIIPHEGDN